MKRATKFLIILICGLLCAGGAIFSAKETAKKNRIKIQVVPINNRERQQTRWLQV
jgi:hypothetical protein